MRGGEDLVPMTPDMLKRIFDESGPDFSSEICAQATKDDLIPEAIEDFCKRWIKKSGNQALARLPWERLLEDAELLVDGQVTYAALMLLELRSHESILLRQGCFEYR
jgi:ATP-dependent DNA helicase RecG